MTAPFKGAFRMNMSTVLTTLNQENTQVEWLEHIVGIANEAREAIRGMSSKRAYKHVEKIVAMSDVVIGVYQDYAQPQGVGTLIIKGKDILEAVDKTGRTLTCRFGAIPCDDREQAEAARIHFSPRTLPCIRGR
jgi:hypothetical protein